MFHVFMKAHVWTWCVTEHGAYFSNPQTQEKKK